ncbi:MAG: PEGA domain-containing protein [Myxococcales bacterium]|nr:PEGA domain-containing protein [Myxococcales bacterium]
MVARSRPALALSLALLAPLARAQPAPDPVEQWIRHGAELRRAGQDDEALVEFRRAWEAGHGARALAQMAMAEQALGRWADADAHVREALASNDPWIARNRAQLQAAAAVVDQHIGRLEVRGTPAGATVTVDGRVVGALPLPEALRVIAGTVTVAVRADGYVESSRSVAVPARTVVRETIELSPAPVAAPPPVAAPAPARVSAEAPAPAASTVAPPPTSDAPAPGGTQRVLGWTAVGLGGASLVGGLVAQLVYASHISNFNADPTCRIYEGMVTGNAGCAAEYDSAGTAQTLAWAGFAVGGALALTGVVLVLTAPSSSGRRAAWTCAPTLGGIGCAGRF